MKHCDQFPPATGPAWKMIEDGFDCGTYCFNAHYHFELRYEPFYRKVTEVFREFCPEFLRKNRRDVIEIEPTFANFEPSYQPAAFNVIKGWAETFSPRESPNLMLIGGPGRGKTHLAKAAVSAIQDQMFTCQIILAPRLAELFHAMQTYNRDGGEKYTSREKYTRLLAADLVLIDDLGTERVTESSLFLEQFQTFLDEKNLGRWIITLNLNFDAFKERYGEKIHSRVLDKNRSGVVVFEGEDGSHREQVNRFIRG